MFDDICDVTLSINFAKSQDSQSQPSTPVQIHQGLETFKCFKCYGTTIDHCSECGDSQKVTGNNPMAQLLNSILMKKITDVKLWDEQEYVQTIKEQEEDLQDKKMECSVCNYECQYSIYECSECPWFNVCQQCESKYTQHCHIINNITTSIGVEEEIHQIKRHCYNCNHKIENCYSVCRTCEKKSVSYWVCDECSDNRSYIHSNKHILETVIDYDNFKDSKMQTESQQFQDDELESQTVYSEVNQLQLPRDSLQLQKQNSSIIRHLQPSDQMDLIRSKTEDQVKNINDDLISRVRFQLDGLFSSYDCNSTHKIMRPPRVVQENGTSCDCSEASKSKQKNSRYYVKSRQKQNKGRQSENYQAYIFYGFKCDVCETQPIKDIKFHCKECEDFDVCQECHESIEEVHEHSSFVKEVGREIKDKALERVSIGRDPLLRVTCYNQIKKTTVRKGGRSKTHRFNTLST